MPTYSIREAYSGSENKLAFFWSKKQADRLIQKMIDDLANQIGGGIHIIAVPITTWREVMMSLGKFIVLVIAAIAVCFLMLHFIPSASSVAFQAPTYTQHQGIHFDGWRITWTMLIFCGALFGCWKLTK